MIDNNDLRKRTGNYRAGPLAPPVLLKPSYLWFTLKFISIYYQIFATMSRGLLTFTLERSYLLEGDQVIRLVGLLHDFIEIIL